VIFGSQEPFFKLIPATIVMKNICLGKVRVKECLMQYFPKDVEE